MDRYALALTPNQWLAQAVQQRRISHARLARMLAVDTSRFSRWLRGDEQIPRPLLLELGQHLPPTDVSYLLHLKDCEDFSDQLRRRAEHLSASLGLGPFPTKVVFQCVQELIDQEHAGDHLSQVETLIRHLVDAAGALLIVQRIVDVNFLEPLLPPESVPRFRYPINHFIGRLLDLDAVVPSPPPSLGRSRNFASASLATSPYPDGKSSEATMAGTRPPILHPRPGTARDQH